MNTSPAWLIGLIVAQTFQCSTWAQTIPTSVDQDVKLSFQFSPYTRHHSHNEAHKNVVMVGLEREHPNGKLDGLTLFSNSFGQESFFLYPWGGVYHDVGDINRLSFKWTAGLLYGYKDPYEDKVPLNSNGFSPGLIAALAYKLQSGWSIQMDMLGGAGLMFQINKELH